MCTLRTDSLQWENFQSTTNPALTAGVKLQTGLSDAEQTSLVPFRNGKLSATVLTVKMSSICGDLGRVSTKPVVQ